MKTINLGQVSSLIQSSTAPTVTNVIWWDTVNKVHKVYDSNLSTWVAFSAAANPSYPFTFTDADLSVTHKLVVTHNLGTLTPDIRIFSPKGIRDLTIDTIEALTEDTVRLNFTAAIEGGTWQGEIKK